ncbi:MAG: tRNA lysidine(34) synthetase TilS [Dissulfurispiraceae bacterium]
MQLIEKVQHTIQKYAMLSENDLILIGLSGGPDSVCLLTILNHLKTKSAYTLHGAYIDHGLRPDETPSEIEFCKELCGSLGIECSIRCISVRSHAKVEGINKQEAARELRYNAFREISSQIHANKIALGHNADDQAETVLMRLFRGSGPSGLAGIPPVRKNIVRPLIEVEKKEIENFLQAEGIGFIVDTSNLGNEYMRNKIRHLIIPSIKKMDRNIIKTISRTADLFRDEERYFEIMVTKTLMRLISRKTETMIDLFLRPLESMDTVLLRRVLRRAIDETRGLRGISFTHIEEIITLIKSGASGDRIYLPQDVRIIKRYSTLTITSEKPYKLPHYLMEGPGDLILKESSLAFHTTIVPREEVDTYGDGKKLAVIDVDKTSFPMLIRARLPGDFFYPLGLGKRKKLQDFFVDEKIPRDERDHVPLLVNKNDIVWIMGYRVDERFKVDKTTQRVLKFEVKPLKS